MLLARGMRPGERARPAVQPNSERGCLVSALSVY